MTDYIKKEVCWCGKVIGTPGHPEHHHYPNKGQKEHDGQSKSPRMQHCECPCHVSDLHLHVQVSAELCCPEARCGDGGTGPGEPGKTGKGDPTGKIPDPPPGSSHDPWDIIQIILKTCRGDTPPPRKDSYLPYIVVRANPGDRGQRPLANRICFWESPDIFVMPNQSSANAPDIPKNLGSMAQAGVPNSVYAHVWNLGRGPAFDIRVEFYWFNPTLGIEETDANLIGFTYVTLGNRNSPKSHAVVRCPVDWIPTFVNNGHECLVVRAYSIISDPLGANPWSASQNRHVAQRNIAVLRGAQGQATPVNLRVAPGHSTHDAQVTTVNLLPEDVPWMQLLTGKRNPGLKPPATAPVVGITPPTVALEAGSLRPNLGALPPEALAQILATQYQFKREADPLELSLVAQARNLTTDEAHVVRVQQTHEDQLVGGFTVILLP